MLKSPLANLMRPRGNQRKGNRVPVRPLSGPPPQGRRPMVSRHAFAAATALLMFAPALAQDNSAPSRISLPATGVYPIREESNQVLGSNLLGAKVVSISNETIGRVSNLVVNENGMVEA